MKKEKLSKALNGIDEIYIEKATNYKKKKAAMPIVKWGTLAASLAIVITGTALIMPFLDTSVPPISTEESTSATENLSESETKLAIDTTTTKYWWTTTENASWGEQYFARIAEGAYKNYAPMKAFQPYEIQVGEKLQDVTVWGFWSNNNKDFFEESDYTGEEEIEYLRAEVYAIEGISPDISVLIKYLDKGDALTTTHYYTFVNKDVENKTETLSDFYECFNADRYFSVKTSADILISEIDHKTASVTNEYYKATAQITDGLRELLLSLDGKSLSDNEAVNSSFSKQLTFDLSLDSAGAYTGYVGVFDNGCIAFHIYSTNHFSFVFDIGEENAEMLMSYIEENDSLSHSHTYGEENDHTLTHTFTEVTVETTL